MFLCVKLDSAVNIVPQRGLSLVWRKILLEDCISAILYRQRDGLGC